MQYIKIVTSDDETRWINLAMVSRVTLAEDTTRGGRQVIVVIFADTDPDARVTIPASDPVNKRAIEQLTARLDALAEAS